jgi:hypothetical protein
MEDKPFVRFASIHIKDGHSRKIRIAKIVSTFTVEALAIGRITEKTDFRLSDNGQSPETQ